MSSIDVQGAAVAAQPPGQQEQQHVRRRERRHLEAVPSADTLTKQEAAGLAKCSPRTIERWVADGYFRAARPIARGSSRVIIDAASFRQFLGLPEQVTS